MIERIVCGKVNCYIVGEPGRFTLVDTATEMYFDRLYARAAAAGVKLIVLTHGHYWHVGGAAKLSAALGVPVGMHSADVPLLTNPKAQPMSADSLVGRVMLRLSKRDMRRKIPPFVPTVDLVDGLDLEAFGASGTVYGLRGHTYGSVGVLYENVLIAGDAASNFFSPCRAKSYADRAAADASYERIKEDSRITTVYAAHGRPIFFDRPRPVMTPVAD